MALWAVYTAFFVFLSILLPCLWVSYIWDQIIDPHYDLDSIDPPEDSMLRYLMAQESTSTIVEFWTLLLFRFFYLQTNKITASLGMRTLIFVIVAGMVVTSAFLDVVRSIHEIQ